VAYDEGLAERIRILVAKRGRFTERKMFGGIGFLLDGNMCVGVLQDELIVRLSAEQADEALHQEHARPFDFTGRAMTGWVMAGPAATATDGALEGWIDRAVSFVSLLPPK
jgi:TfoX/Sxy family transcriptional regulator of competence genes